MATDPTRDFAEYLGHEPIHIHSHGPRLRDYLRDRDLALRTMPPFSLVRYAEPRTDDMRQMLQDLGLETPRERLVAWALGPTRTIIGKSWREL